MIYLFGFKNKNKSQKLNNNSHEYTLSTKLLENVEVVKKIFNMDDNLIERYFENHLDSGISCCIFYSDGMADNKIINESIIYPLQTSTTKKSSTSIIDILANQVLRINDIKKTTNIEDIIQAIVYGDTVFFVEGSADALILNTKSFLLRAATEPEGEKIIRGPREGFNEGILANLSMLRRRIRTQDLKMRYKTFGTRTKTKACICYLEGLVNEKILNELYSRLDKFELDGVFDINYIIESIKDAPKSPFKTIGMTERPDVVAGKLLEGRIALFLDGTPMVMVLPFLFIENFQSNEDYYVPYIYASISRFFRLIGFAITICLPAFYIAILTFHQEMLPTSLFTSISMARKGVPFPTVIEVLGMVIIFQLLAETGIRMPAGIGQTLSIVGALVIGQSAVEARIVSAPVIIVVALTGITGLVVPRLSTATLVARLMLIVFSSLLGLYGFVFGLVLLLIHLLNLRSFGVPYITDIVTLDFQKNKDIFIRAPWWKMIKRPQFIASDKVRQKTDGKKRP